jgi:hypothetical protein
VRRNYALHLNERTKHPPADGCSRRESRCIGPLARRCAVDGIRQGKFLLSGPVGTSAMSSRRGLTFLCQHLARCCWNKRARILSFEKKTADKEK